MREIKFRAWDKASCSMLDETSGHFRYEEDNGFHCGYCNEHTGDWESCPIMQYTGLKDKNGKEIYEGDILDHKYKCEVVFSKGSFLVTPCGWKQSQLLHLFLHTRYRAGCAGEIIGNIYENPELLNKENIA